MKCTEKRYKEDRRQTMRRRAEWTGQLFDNAESHGPFRRRSHAVVCSDFSTDGLRLVSYQGGRVGNRVRVALNTPSGTLRFRGTIVRQRGSERGELGIKLTPWSLTNWHSMRRVSQK